MTEEINVDLTEEEATSFPEQNLNPQEQAAQEVTPSMERYLSVLNIAAKK